MRLAPLFATIGLMAISAPAVAGTVIPECRAPDSGCSYAFSEVNGASGQLGEVRSAGQYRRTATQGGIDNRSTQVSLFDTSPKGFTFEGGASGSLSSGALHASISQAAGFAQASVRLKDIVMFEFDPALVAAGATRTTGTMKWTLEGRQQEIPGQSYANLTATVSLLTRRWFGTQMTDSDFPLLSDGSEPFVGSGAFGGTISRDFTIIPGEYYDFDALLHVSAGGYTVGKDPAGNDLSSTAPSSADYSNTSFINFVLPAGVKLLSGSGEFLDAPYSPGGVTSAVPEPGTWSMLLIGFAVIGCFMRRRRGDADRRISLRPAVSCA